MNFEGFELTFVAYDMKEEIPEFYFEYHGILIVLYYIESLGWLVYVLHMDQTKEIAESSFARFMNPKPGKGNVKLGKKMIHHLLEESPMRLWCLFEFGAGFFEPYLTK